MNSSLGSSVHSLVDSARKTRGRKEVKLSDEEDEVALEGKRSRRSEDSLVDEGERSVAEFDQRHEVHDGRERSFSTRLMSRREELHLVGRSERDQNLDGPFGVV